MMGFDVDAASIVLLCSLEPRSQLTSECWKNQIDQADERQGVFYCSRGYYLVVVMKSDGTEWASGT